MLPSSSNTHSSSTSSRNRLISSTRRRQPSPPQEGRGLRPRRLLLLASQLLRISPKRWPALEDFMAMLMRITLSELVWVVVVEGTDRPPPSRLRGMRSKARPRMATCISSTIRRHMASTIRNNSSISSNNSFTSNCNSNNNTITNTSTTNTSSSSSTCSSNLGMLVGCPRAWVISRGIIVNKQETFTYSFSHSILNH